MRFIYFGLAFLFLGACSTPQLPITQESHHLSDKLQQNNKRLTSWEMIASTSLTTKEASYSLTAFWQQNEDRYDLRFDAPFNTGILKIKGRAGFSELILKNKKAIQGDNPEQLIAAVTPFKIPVTGLMHWIRGIPHKNSKSLLDINANGDTKKIKQDGWLIHYDDWGEKKINSQTYRLPSYVHLEQSDIDIKISPSQWKKLKATVKKANPIFSDLEF